MFCLQRWESIAHVCAVVKYKSTMPAAASGSAARSRYSPAALRLLPAEALRCPVTNAPYACVFDLLDKPLDVRRVKFEEVVLAWDSQPHDGRRCVLFADTHVQQVKEEVFAAYAAKIADIVRALAEKQQ